ncbi:hypothetical protein STCU_10879 [Strigomonas culicis]|uniref:Uncharacterized protein n=1 Tax=Strigomonas culicis TaxID=28005 RepID=S9TFY1_9TRYP|nr:hypothetical protein STCU_10879 [Strigomonas culicis]|eukprot:EPY16977.1 hypothetical protein STCU_10879 [Strigomonas culicis]
MRAHAVDDSYQDTSLRTYFRAAEDAGAAGPDTHTLTAEAKRGASANRWVQEVLHEPSYAVAPLSTVFSLYMRRQMTDH